MVVGACVEPLLFRQPQLLHARAIASMDIAIQLANGGGAVLTGGGTVLTGYLAGAALGPAISATSAAALGVKNGYSWTELRVSIGFAIFFTALTVALVAAATTLGSTTVALVPTVLRIPLTIGLLAITLPLLPVTAVITGTMAAPAIPFREKK